VLNANTQSGAKCRCAAPLNASIARVNNGPHEEIGANLPSQPQQLAADAALNRRSQRSYG
jgi:hypothetical protein